MDGAAVFQVAADADGQIVQTAFFPNQSDKIGQGLGGVQVAAVAGVDDGAEDGGWR